MFVIAVGNLICGYTFLGPFGSYSQAEEFGVRNDFVEAEWEIIPITSPNDLKVKV